MGEYKALSIEEERIGKLIVNASFKVHKELGPGLLERIYEACLEYELRSAGLDVKRQLKIPIKYAGQTFDEGIRLDLLVERKVVIEIKAVDEMHDVWQAQIISHLRLTQLRLGYLINFNVPLIKDGIRRLIL
jgi:GxxExxY protein